MEARLIIVLILAFITLKSGVSGCLSFIVSTILLSYTGYMIYEEWGLIIGIILSTVVSFRRVGV